MIGRLRITAAEVAALPVMTPNPGYSLGVKRWRYRWGERWFVGEFAESFTARDGSRIEPIRRYRAVIRVPAGRMER